MCILKNVLKQGVSETKRFILEVIDLMCQTPVTFIISVMPRLQQQTIIFS